MYRRDNLEDLPICILLSKLSWTLSSFRALLSAIDNCYFNDSLVFILESNLKIAKIYYYSKYSYADSGIFFRKGFRSEKCVYLAIDNDGAVDISANQSVTKGVKVSFQRSGRVADRNTVVGQLGVLLLQALNHVMKADNLLDFNFAFFLGDIDNFDFATVVFCASLQDLDEFQLVSLAAIPYKNGKNFSGSTFELCGTMLLDLWVGVRHVLESKRHYKQSKSLRKGPGTFLFLLKNNKAKNLGVTTFTVKKQSL